MGKHFVACRRRPGWNKIWERAARRTVLVFAALLLPATLIGQSTQTGDLTGRITDSRGIPIEGVRVEIATPQRSVLTDRNGTFLLRSLPAGEHLLEISRIGYAPAQLEVNLVGSGGRRAAPVDPVEIILRAAPLEIQGLTVTGLGGSRDPLSASQATTSLSGRALRERSGPTLAQTLEFEAGIASRTQGPSASMPIVRGMTGDRILILQDGQRAGDIAGSSVDHGMTIDPLSAERIEVIRGPATLLYGNNALGGVVNVLTSDIPRELPGQASWRGALQAESAYPGGGISLGGALPLAARWAMSLRGGARQSGDTRTPHDPSDPEDRGRVRNTQSQNRNGSMGIAYFGEMLEAGASVKGYDFSYGLPESPLDDAVTLHGHRYEGSGRAEFSLGSALVESVRLHFSAQEYAHQEIEEDGGLGQAFDQSMRTGELQLRQGALGRLSSGAWGFSALWKEYHAGGEEALTPPADSRGLGIFGVQEISLGRPTLELGARYDDYRIAARPADKFPEILPGTGRSFGALSGSVGLRVPFGAGIGAGFSIARTFRAPTVEELYSNEFHAGTAAWEQGDPDLAAEAGSGAEIVLRAQRSHWQAEIAAYRNEIEHYIFLRYQGERLHAGRQVPVLTYVQDRVRIDGVDGYFRWAPSTAWRIGLSGDYLRAGQIDGPPLSYMPSPRIGASTEWLGSRFSLGGDLQHRFAQKRTGVGAAVEPTTPAYTLIRLTGGWTLRLGEREHALTVRIDNLTNQLFREATSVTKGYAPGPGRNLALIYRAAW